MRNPAVLLLALAVLAPLAAGAAPWLQPGHDSARTSATDDPGPEKEDVAFVARVPGSRAGWSQPFVVDGKVVVVAADEGDENLSANGLFEVDLRTALVREIAPLPQAYGEGATDGTVLVLSREGGLDAFSLADGIPLWTWDHPPVVRERMSSSCTPTVDGATVKVVCVEADAADEALRANSTVSGLVAASLDLRSGRELWTWTRDLGQETFAKLTDRPGQDVAFPLRTAPAFGRVDFYDIAAIGPYVVVAASEIPEVALVPDATGVEAGGRQFTVWALDGETGSLRWAKNTTFGKSVVAVEGSNRTVLVGEAQPGSPFATGSATTVYLKLDQLVAVNLALGDVLWKTDVGTEDASLADSMSGFALGPEALFVATEKTFHRFDTRTGIEDWRFGLDHDAGEAWGQSRPVLAGRGIFARAFDPSGNSVMYALDPETGELLWRHVLVPAAARPPLSFGPPFTFAVGDGVLVAAGIDGTVHVLGASPVALAAVAEASDAFPDPGEEVEVDLSGSRAGAFGPATTYRADWGDGRTTDWQADPVLRHTYEAPRDRMARFYARNDAGQVGVETIAFHVGTPRPTPLERAFSRDNQEITFFVLGIAITGVGAAFSVVRVQRRKVNLKRLLAAVETAAEHAHEDADLLERELARARTEGRVALLAGRLDGSQFAALEARINELQRDVRLTALDHRFDYLPLGMVRTMRKMLADGTITAWEHRHFLKALEQETVLTREQKDQVRHLVDSWFLRDQEGE